MSAPRRLAWVLNLDAEDELSGRPVTTPSARALARIQEAKRSLRPLVGEGAVVLGEGCDREARGLQGRAFCPTPSALQALARVGAVVPEAPAVSVLARVNHRAFSARLGQGLPRGVFVTRLEELEGVMASPLEGGWLLKHPFGHVGRRRLHVSSLDPRARAFAARALRGAGGLQVEPMVERLGDFAIHGFVGRCGTMLGAPTMQECDALGAWRRSSRSHDLTEREAQALIAEGDRVGLALRAEGYFGPFGVDGFRYLWEGEPSLCVRCEVNARYSMGWAVGMGESRPDQGTP